MEVMGIRLRPINNDQASQMEEEIKSQEQPQENNEEMIEGMLSRILTHGEQVEYKQMLQKIPILFVKDYINVRGVDIVQHQIELKPKSQPQTQKLRRLGVVKEEALLKEVRKLLSTSFIYPVDNSEWVSPVVVTSKKNGFVEEGLQRVCLQGFVEEGLQRLNGFEGQLHLDKCHIGEDEVILLGHKISQRGIVVDPAKAKALFELPSPKSIKEVTSFMQKMFNVGVEAIIIAKLNGNKRLSYGPRQAVIANGPFEKWGIKAMGPLPRTANGKLYILVAIEYMTRFGIPLEIVIDNGPRFRKGLLMKVCEELKISHRHSTPYYPQSNGLVEKANGIIAGIIKKMVDSKPKHWDNFLDGAIWAYKTTYRDATQFTPFHLVYGQEALQPIELNIPTIYFKDRQEQNNDEAWIDRLLTLVELEWKREVAYHYYERKALQLNDKLNEGLKDKGLKEKSLVLRYNNAFDNRFDAKFERRWEGPFIVKKAFTGGYLQVGAIN
ncbi:hypothetical protein L7F22_064376 [Adiantum nelumboides]|nr:hypothetical protein [Adiantum nelumboides]